MNTAVVGLSHSSLVGENDPAPEVVARIERTAGFSVGTVVPQ